MPVAIVRSREAEARRKKWGAALSAPLLIACAIASVMASPRAFGADDFQEAVSAQASRVVEAIQGKWQMQLSHQPGSGGTCSGYDTYCVDVTFLDPLPMATFRVTNKLTGSTSFNQAKSDEEQQKNKLGQRAQQLQAALTSFALVEANRRIETDNALMQRLTAFEADLPRRVEEAVIVKLLDKIQELDSRLKALEGRSR